MTDSPPPVSEEQSLAAPAAEMPPAPGDVAVQAEGGGPLQALAEPFATPIAGPSPSGENARHDERHVAIRNEVDKLGRPSGEEVDWNLVHDLGRALLTEKSKDHLIASYFAVAAYLRGGPRGLIEGIAAISALLEGYWDDGFPPPERLRARVHAIDWFIDRVASHGHLAPTAVQDGDLQMLGPAMQKLETLVLQRFHEEAPNIHGLKETLKPIELAIASQTTSEPASEPRPAEPAEPGEPPPSPVASPPPEPAVGVATPEASTDPITAKLAELSRPFASPVPGPNRAGENARHHESHEAVRREVDKLGKPTAQEVDWDLVQRAGRSLLTETSKDFLIASYFAVASYVRGGVHGLVVGLAALVALLRDYWDDGFPPPKRIRGRINAIDWFIDRVDTLGELAPKKVEEGDLQLLSLAAKELESLTLERFQDETPNIYGLKQTLKTIELAIAKQTPSPAPDTPAPGATAQPTAPQQPGTAQPATPAGRVELASPTAQLADPAEVSKFLKEVGDSLHKASRALFKASKQDPLAYRLCRQGLYMIFVQAPQASSGNQTTVPPPSGGRDAALNALLQSQNWDALLDEAESGLANARLWLDQHRFVALALEGLGYEKARETVVAETAAVAQRLPDLLDREFSDGQPFASTATREWLQVISSGTASPTSAGVSSTQDSDAFGEALAEAHKLAVGGKLEDAVQKLAELRSETTFGRDRFRAKLAMANACAAAGSPVLAEGILAGLSEEIRQFRLEEWEPNMAEACYRARYEALAAMATESAKSREELVDVYRQLCKVAPAAALKLGRPPAGPNR